MPMDAEVKSGIRGAAGDPIPHDSGHLHVSGEATYTDDIVEPVGLLHVAVGLSTKPHARIASMNLDAVRNAPGVVAVMTADDIPGRNNCGPVVDDDPIMAPGLVQYVGQAVFAVAAESVTAARLAVTLAEIEYETLPALLDARSALEAESFVLPSEVLKRGDSAAAIKNAAHRLTGSVSLGPPRRRR